MFNRQGGPGGGQGGGARPQMPVVWLMGKDGKMTIAFVRTGVADTSYSEIVRGEVKEGDVVVTGLLTASTLTQQGGPGMGGMMFMGGPPGGGRR
jgi:HlyD family secretion protein